MNRINLMLFGFASFFCIHAMETNTVNENTTETEYRPFVEDGKQWIVLSADYRIYYTKTYYIDGDTVVGTQPCKKLMLHYKHYQNGTEYTSLYCCIYEEDKKVFYFPADVVLPASPILLYDFNVTSGDTISLGGQRDDIHSVVCYRVWQDYQQGIKDDVFHVLLATENDPSITYADQRSVLPLYKWYERIGSRIHPFVKKPWNRKMGGMLEYLYECRVNDNVIYFDRHGGPTLPDNIDIFKEDFSTSKFRYTIDGKRISGKPAHGIYIEKQGSAKANGKKVLIK